MKRQATTGDVWKTPTKIWNVMFISIFISNIGLNMGQQMSNSLLGVYAKSLNAPAVQIGQLMSAFAITALIFHFISGPAMNTYNRKKLLIISMGFMAIAFLGFGFSPDIAQKFGMDPVQVMILFRLIQGVGNAFGNGCSLTIVTDMLPRKQFTTGMSYYACAQAISQAIGPTVGVFLRDLMGYHNTYIVFFFVMLGAMVLTMRVRTMPQKTIPFSLKLDNIIAKEAVALGCITLFMVIGYAAINSFLLVYAEEKHIAGGALFFTVYAATLLLSRPIVGRLTDKYGFVQVAIPFLLMTVISLLLIGYSQKLWMLLLAAAANAFGFGAVQPMLQSLCMKAVPQERRGSASATNYIFMDIGTILGSNICGFVAEIYGYTEIMWNVMATSVLLGGVVIFLVRDKIVKIERQFIES